MNKTSMTDRETYTVKECDVGFSVTPVSCAQILERALHYCYEKLQPLQPFEDWVREIGK